MRSLGVQEDEGGGGGHASGDLTFEFAEVLPFGNPYTGGGQAAHGAAARASSGCRWEPNAVHKKWRLLSAHPSWPGSGSQREHDCSKEQNNQRSASPTPQRSADSEVHPCSRLPPVPIAEVNRGTGPRLRGQRCPARLQQALKQPGLGACFEFALLKKTPESKRFKAPWYLIAQFKPADVGRNGTTSRLRAVQ